MDPSLRNALAASATILAAAGIGVGLATSSSSPNTASSAPSAIAPSELERLAAIEAAALEAWQRAPKGATKAELHRAYLRARAESMAAMKSPPKGTP